MARSLNKKYFGNRNIGTAGTGDDNIGGQGVASVTISGSWASFTAGTTTVTFSAPSLPGGVTATGTAVIDGSGVVTGVTITETGSGYTAVPTVTIADSDGGGETTGTATAVLTTDTGNVGSSTNQENALTPFAKTTSGGTSQVADIVRQVSARRYKVTTADGTAICKLKGSAVSAAGEMTITATDASAGTYFVTKLTAHKATLTRGTGTVYADGTAVQWTFGSATATVCKLANA